MTLANRPSITQQKVMFGVTTPAVVAATTVIPLCVMDGDYRVDKLEVEIPGGYTIDPANYYDLSVQSSPRAITAVAATDIITLTGHGFATGDALQFTTTGSLPAPIAVGVTYFAIVLDVNTFKIATTAANAAAGTAIDITTAGATSFAGKVMAIYSLLTGSPLGGVSLITLVFTKAFNFGNPTGLAADQLNVVLTKFGTGVNIAAGSQFVAHLKQYNGL